MRHPDRSRFRRVAPALGPALLAALALVLMAPTCQPTTPGVKTFAKGSIVIPMDACYQGDAAVTPTSCSARDVGNVIQAYGLVYQLIRNNIPVYWVIKQNKASLTDVDLTVQLSGGPPVGVYDWTNGATGGMPPSNANPIDYRGGPFVVDASDFAAANALFQTGNAGTGTPALKTLYSAVNLHVTQVAFQGYAAKTFAGGWNAGGTVAPKLALLNIPGGDGRYADHVLEGYLIRAALAPACVLNNPPCADNSAGTASPSGHGTIYDRLEAADFIPPTCTSTAQCQAVEPTSICDTGAGRCDWKATNFHRYSYRILWLPHWKGPNSCEGVLGNGYSCGTGFGGCGFAGSDTCSCVNNCTAQLTAAELDLVLRTIGAFQQAGNDVFGECAGLGTLEGVYNAGTATVDGSFGDGEATSRFQTSWGTGGSGGGMHISATAPTAACTAGQGSKQCVNGALYEPSYYPSPFLQLGDFPFTPVSGAITEYRPATGNGATGYVGGVATLIARMNGGTEVDYFTFLPGVADRGNVVYLGGHDYSGYQGTFQIAGTRLVLNTLFNLGAACVETLAPCSTGQLGVCGEGEMRCVGSVPTCVQKNQPSAEVCDGRDNDCNGAVDDGLVQSCYDGPAGTQGVGICHGGTRTCVETSPGNFGMSACLGQVLPAAEECNGLDDDCDGQVDDGLGSRSCYDGPPATQDVGTCRAGTQTCSSGSWGICNGEVLPLGYDVCEPVQDTNCNGAVGDGCGCYPQGSTRPCYGGPAGTENVGICRGGAQTCGASGIFGNCDGDVRPGARACNGLDNDCDGVVDTEQLCCDGGAPASSRTCYGGPAGTLGVGVCRGGTQICVGAAWSSGCDGQILPGPELCNAKDDDCNGVPDDGTPICPPGSSCVNGVCVPGSCGPEGPFCPGGYTCTGASCVIGNCGAGGPCTNGQVCQGGTCVDPCAAMTCGPGAYCSGGLCVGGGCYVTGCPAGQLCVQGTCQADPCAGRSCPTGTFCREGYCVQSCVFVACPTAQRCGQDGFCQADPCSGTICGAGQVCLNGTCQTNQCASVTCGAGQVCNPENGTCVPDPCTGVTCPVGQCLSGQCYSSNPGGGPAPPPPIGPDVKESSGCGCGSAPAGELGLLLLGLLLPWRRRAARRAAIRHRRSLRHAGAALALFLALTAAGCSSKEETPNPCTNPNCNGACVDFQNDPANCATCGHACSAGQICVEGACGPSSAVAPQITGVSPASAASGTTQAVSLTGQRFQANAQVVVLGAGAQAVTASVADSGHLSATLDFTAVSPGAAEIRVVNPDHVISNGADFDVTLAAPVLTGLACQGASCVPASGTSATTAVGSGSPVAVTLVLSGTGLVSSSQCRIASTNFPEMALPSALSGGQLQCTLDLRLTDPGDYQVTVMNGGVARSNPLTFTVLTNTPTLTSISPTAARAGEVVALTVTGSGFDQSSEVLVDGSTTFNGSAIVTTFVSGTRLVAQPVDLRGAAAETHTVTVRNGATAGTGSATFTVDPAAPTLSTVSPTSARQGAAVALQVTGANYDASTRIEVQAPGAGTFTPIAATVVDSATQAHAPYAFGQEGSWLVRVTNAAGASGPLSVRVLSNVAILSGVSPASAQQGQTVTLTLTATNLDASPTVHLASPSLGCPTAPCSLDRTPTVSGSTLTVTGLSLAGWDAGTYAVTVVNPGAAGSNALGFTVTPGAPTLAAPASPACVLQSATPTTVTLTGTNFAKPDAGGNGGSTVHASSAAIPDYVVPGVTVTSTTTLTVSFDSSAAIPDNYTLQVWNPGPAILKSGTIPFKVAASYAAPPLNACP
ncbi:MAG TPA: IPT/TIG domain-containing protein [Anaeromyxobacteraceae bacterium]|nr:IPT/TIG domain-containing protein [Anaeromyxobacteraceae bacterium]